MYKTVVIEYSPKAEDMAQKIEEKANEMIQEGYEDTRGLRTSYYVNYRNCESNFSI